MIIDSFDNKSKPFLTAEHFYGSKERNDIVTLVTFKQKVVDAVIKEFNGKLEASYHTTNGEQEIYSFIYKDKKYQIFMTGIGATLASTLMKEVSVVTGSHKFIYFGSCGVLNEELCRGKIIVPTEAYRDEGISYHYAAPSDFIRVRNNLKVQEALGRFNIPFVAGKVWTTDAIYMETINKVNRHKKEGCLAVEMEVSGVEAVARYYEIENYHILFSADSLGNEEDWYRVDLGGDKELELQLKACKIALDIATTL